MLAAAEAPVCPTCLLSMPTKVPLVTADLGMALKGNLVTNVASSVRCQQGTADGGIGVT